MNQTSVCIGPGGIMDKESHNNVSNKVLIGDKMGQLHLFDSSRKLMLDKKVIFENARRI